MRLKTLITLVFVFFAFEIFAGINLTQSLKSDLSFSYIGTNANTYHINLFNLPALINNDSYERYPLFIAYLPKLKYEIGYISSISLGVSTIDYEGEIPIWWHHGPFIESGLSFNDKQNYMCNKVGYEYFWLFYGGRINILHYTEFQNHQFCLRPEVGLSLASYITLTYGYNFSISKSNSFIKNGSIISINLAYCILKKRFR